MAWAHELRGGNVPTSVPTPRQQYLWRAVDEDGDVIDILVQSRRDRRAATRFFRKLLKGQGCVPRRLITDKLRSYATAHRTVMPSVIHRTGQYGNNRAEVSPSRPGSAIDRCAGLSLPRTRSVFCRCTDL